jgi:hypothetical protein
VGGLVETDLNGLIMEVGEAAELNRSGREPSEMRLRDDSEHNLSLCSRFTSTARSRKSCATGVRTCRCRRCRGSHPEHQRERGEYSEQ